MRILDTATGPTYPPRRFPGHLGRPIREYLRLSINARSSRRGDAARIVDTRDTVRYPLTILMAVSLCSVFRSRTLRRLAIRSSTYTGAPYITRDRTTPSYSWRTAIPTPLMFDSRPYKALAAANTLRTRESKCGPSFHWLSMMRPRYFIRDPTSTAFAPLAVRAPTPEPLYGITSRLGFTFVPLLLLALLLSSHFSGVILDKIIFLLQARNFVQLSSFFTIHKINLSVVSGVPT